MKQSASIMGMPITVEIIDQAAQKNFDQVFDYFRAIDEKFSTYKPTSEISRLNRGEIQPNEYSEDIKMILQLAEETKKQTQGYFDIKKPEGSIDPSGLVKGWAIQNAAKILEQEGFKNFYVEAGGDIQVAGTNSQNQKWRVGIKNPFNPAEVVKVVCLSNQGIATSGSYERGSHIYNPHMSKQSINDIVSLSVIGPNIYEADRFATAAFAMGRSGIEFIEKLPGFEGFMIDKDGIGTETSGWHIYNL